MILPALSNALAARGYETLTPVQEAVTDPALSGSDLLVSAQTGSGKTVGFGLAIAPTLLGGEDRLPPAAAPLALIVAPTRELALQVMRELSWLYAEAGARLVTCVGGMDARDERRALERGAHIVVGTPGRLCDHINRGALDMTSLRAIVLDEADEMLDLGFREDLEFMLAAAPEDRRTLMFSATVPPMIAKLAEKFQRDAHRVTTLTGAKQHADIAYQALTVSPQDAEGAVINLLRYHDAQNAIVFANTRAMVARLTARLSNRGFAVVSLSGELSQSERTHALQAMRDGRARVCVATDVAARGIDLPNLDLVVHAELPTNSEGLLHRSGRTGRAGRKGISALIVPVKSANKAERLLKFAKITAEWTTPPTPEDIEAKDRERLLSDPVWSETPSETEGAFATELLALHSPEVIAAAYLRLYKSRWSAPEELSAPGTPAPARERSAFGPSRWFALSVGNNDRAEARWLLPLLCRVGNLDKSAIGAIRVQASETFVELAEAAVPGFMSALGEGGQLDEGISARALDKAPEFAPAPRADRPERSPRAPREDRPARAPREQKTSREHHAPRDSAPRPAPKPRPKPAGAPPAAMARAVEDGTVTPYRKPRSDAGDAPRPAKKPWSGDKPAGKPASKPFGKPAGDRKPGKPYGKAEGKPTSKPFGKPGAKSSDKPFDKPRARPAPRDAEPAAPRPNLAADTSKRFVPPGAAKKPGKPGAGKGPAGKPGAGKPKGKGAPPKARAGFGGTTPPKRGKP
ncbi:Superfamily II DNA and RNA helicase [Roseovarius mucosus DSM 17069]|uniref:Superfamily II DNA and RNA helicase n=1 Tax=Roseovarius mucosus DSM 17069 TaxID=1288298 RepID=A0A0A0HR48_9RHOB|nr:DEAD/DEAH box helicase [Roseovarius mucosus]KGM89094.1 Superfamily II DNA and RNA helicase [Roseovarius mucosus DSM 17069]